MNALAIRAGAGALLALPVIAGLFARQAVAQTYPNSLIRIIVPYAAGGVTDSLARITGAQVAEAVGQPVIIENRPGASSMLGMQACANAKPDGYTICVTVADSLSYNPQLFASLPYDPEQSFAPVMRLALTNNLLVANSKTPFNSYKEMTAYAKANPGKLNWATWGPATLPDLYLRWVSSQAGVKIQAIPYKGERPRRIPRSTRARPTSHTWASVPPPRKLRPERSSLWWPWGPNAPSSCRNCHPSGRKGAIPAFRVTSACLRRAERRSRSCNG